MFFIFFPSGVLGKEAHQGRLALSPPPPRSTWLYVGSSHPGICVCVCACVWEPSPTGLCDPLLLLLLPCPQASAREVAGAYIQQLQELQLREVEELGREAQQHAQEAAHKHGAAQVAVHGVGGSCTVLVYVCGGRGVRGRGTDAGWALRATISDARMPRAQAVAPFINKLLCIVRIMGWGGVGGLRHS